MQTAVGTFGGEGYKDGLNAPLLMTAGAGNSDRPAISSLNCPPFIAVESCREHLVCLLIHLLHNWHLLKSNFFEMFLFLVQGVHPCDRRRDITKYREMFPAIDFSLASTYSIETMIFFYRFTLDRLWCFLPMFSHFLIFLYTDRK